MSSQQPQVIGVRKLPLEQRFLMHGFIACALVAAAYYIAVRPERAGLAAAQAALASQEKDLQETASLPHVADNLPAAITEMTSRRDKLLARLKESGDASTLYDKIGKLGQRSGIRTDRIDPLRADNRSMNAAPKLDSKALALESFGYQIEMVGTYENIAKFIDAINNETGVTVISAMNLEPMEAVEGKPAQVRGTITTVHYKLPVKKDLPANSGGTGATKS